jgi:hypothetical protein
MSRKMHELLAVEADLQRNFKAILEEGKVTFSKKPDHFTGHSKTLKMKDDERAFEEPAATEHKEITTTVDKKLDYTQKSAIKYFDALLQKEVANQTTKADLKIDGKVIAKDLPATFLLGMESRLKMIREMYAQIPTLQPGTKWEIDKNQGVGVYVAEPDDVREKTEKREDFKTIAEATKEHPAQIAKIVMNSVIGLFTTKRWSGMITPGQKSDLLTRIDKLHRAFKQARQRANQVDIQSVKIGKDLFQYIRSGEVAKGK